MKKLLSFSIVLMLVLVPLQIAVAQVLRSKTFAFPSFGRSGTSEILSAITLDSSNSIVAIKDYNSIILNQGRSCRFYKVDSLLDTIVSYQLNFYCQNTILLTSFDKQRVYMVGSYLRLPSYPVLFVQKLFPNMFPEWEANYDTGSIHTYPHAATIDSSDNIYVLGEYTDTTTENIFITKVNTFGQQEWFRRYSWWAGYQVPYSIKQLQNGRFLVSGSVGSQIGTMEIDENGTVTRPFSVLYTPTSRSTAFNTVCTPLPSNKILFSANQFNDRYIYGVADGVSGQIDWVRDQAGFASFPGVYSTESTFVLCENDSGYRNINYSKYDFNGRLIWRIPVASSSRYYMRDVLPTPSGNGLAYGYELTLNPTTTTGLLQWIANVGRPAPPLYQSRQQGVVSTFCYPSPARGSTVMSLPLDHGLPSLSITLTSQLGQQQHRTALVGNGGYELPLHDLSAGLYTLQTTVAGKTYRARVVVE